MRAAATVGDVLADPVGAYFAGESFLVWFHPRLAGAVAFGQLAAADRPSLAELLVTPVLERGYAILCDCGAVEVLDERAFELLAGYLDHRGAELLANIGRFALVRPSGLAGAGIAGLFYEKIRAFVEAGLFDDRSAALDWLGYAADAPERAEIDELIAVHDVPAVLRALRAWLLQAIAGATLVEAARALAISERSLQRELARARTSFRTELSRARVRVAENLLITTDDKIEAIARQLGFASVPAFTTLFGRVYGESPLELRRRRGRG